MITSTFLTLLVVPVVYTWMDRFTLKGKYAEEKQDNVVPLPSAGSEQEEPAPARLAREER